MINYKEISNCRISGSNKITKFLDLGYQPLANSLKKSPKYKEQKYPLSISYCKDSNLIQLNETVSKFKLFKDYIWITGTSKKTLKYLKKFALKISNINEIKKKDLIIEIASNDGSLLKILKNIGFKNILGVDPAKNLSKILIKNKIYTINKFWSSKLAKYIRKKNGPAKIIIARNVMSHVSNIKDVVQGIRIAMDNDGIGLIEFHDASKILQELHYDSIYHEHLFYYSLNSLSFILEKNKLNPFHIEKSPISGGSLVLFFDKGKRKKKKSIIERLLFEKQHKINCYKSWLKFARNVHKHKEVTLKTLKKFSNKKILGFGSSARSQTFLNFCEIDSQKIMAIIDNNPLKQNLYSPGTSIPIVSFKKGMRLEPDIIFILAWNFKNEIIKQCRQHGYQGKFITAFPKTIQIL